MRDVLRSWAIGILILTIGCGPFTDQKDDDETVDTGLALESGDIIVSNGGTDNVLVLNSDGSYKGVLYDVDNTAETIFGVDYSASLGGVLVVVDGADRVMFVPADDWSAPSIFISTPLLAGNLRGINQLANGDILIVETNNIERFTSAGVRVTAGAWPKALQTGGTAVRRRLGGGFVHCSNGSDVVRTYNDSGVQQATKSSGIAGTTDAMGCMELSDGSIAVLWSGTTDTVAIYSADLSTTLATYNNTSILAAPNGIAERPNGNLLILDVGYHYIVEIKPNGDYVGVLGDDVLNLPQFIDVVP